MRKVKHPDEGAILQYVAGRLPDEERAVIDAHSLGCSRCWGKIRGLLYLREHFEEIGRTWTAAEYGFFLRQRMLARALEGKPTLLRRVREWIRRRAAGLSPDFSVLLDGTKNVAAMAFNLPGGYEGRLHPAYSGVGSPEQVAALREHLARGSELLSKGKPRDSKRELLRAVKIDARSPQSAVTDVIRDGKLFLQVTADSRRRCISLKAFPEPGHPAPALAVLLPGRSDGAVFLSGFLPLPGETATLAAFQGVADGVYTIELDCD